MGQREPSFVNSRPVDNPFRIEPVRLLQIPVADHPFREIAPRPEDLYAEQRMGGMRRMDLATGHR